MRKSKRRTKITEEEELMDALDKAWDESKKQKYTETILDKTIKVFKKDGYKQNNYWEYDDFGKVYWSSFINRNLEVVSVFIDGDKV